MTLESNYVRVCVCVLTHVWLFATPWPVARQALLSMEFFRQEYWSGLPFPSPEDLPDPGIKPVSLVSAALASRFLTTEPPGKPKATILQCGISILSAPLIACPSAQWMVSLRPVTTNRRLTLILILMMISVSEGIWLRSWEASKVSLQPSSSTITGIYLECPESFQFNPKLWSRHIAIKGPIANTLYIQNISIKIAFSGGRQRIFNLERHKCEKK